jgi:hypothetical protein
VFPGKVFCTKRTEEEFVICEVLRCSGVQLLYLFLGEGGENEDAQNLK